MKILLQQTRTQLFLKTADAWTANPYEALDFEHSQRAVEFARDHHMSGVQIVVKFIDGQFDQVVPIPDSKSTHSHH